MELISHAPHILNLPKVVPDCGSTRTVTPREPPHANTLPLGENATALTMPSPKQRVSTILRCSTTSNTSTVAASVPQASNRPSAEKSMHSTFAVVVNAAIWRELERSHTSIESPWAAHATLSLARDTATHSTWRLLRWRSTVTLRA